MFKNFVETCSKLSKKDIFSLLLACLGISISLFGFAVLWQSINTVQAQDIQSPIHDSNTSVSITVDVGGAVKKPGIYTLQQGDRVAQAIEKAEGFSDAADAYYITQTFNLAALLIDEQKVYIPFKVEQQLQKSQSIKTAESDTNLISINTATIDELDSLEGVGEKRAEAIMAARPYTALNELVTKNVISDSLFKSIEKDVKL